MSLQPSDMGSIEPRRRSPKGEAASGPSSDRREPGTRRTPFVVRGSTVETPEGFKLRF